MLEIQSEYLNFTHQFVDFHVLVLLSGNLKCQSLPIKWQKQAIVSHILFIPFSGCSPLVNSVIKIVLGVQKKIK